ncbi:MAG: hypothetical protein JW874_11110 [Spirochaetales bacterium]|nr:hypothetical protein [Spirochaetales bacterium]
MSETVFVRTYQNNDLPGCREMWKELAETHRELYDDPTIGSNKGIFQSRL